MAVTINGTSGVTYPAGGTDNVAGSGVGTTDSQTLTNKTLTSPTITGATLGVTTFNGGVITSGTAQATTSGTAVGFTGIPSWVKKITFMANALQSSGSLAVIQIGSGSYTTSGYNSSYVQLSSGGVSYGASSTGFVVTGTSAGYGLITLALQNGSNNWTASGNFQASTSIISTAGQVALSGALDRIQITVPSGTFSAGSVNIIYEG